MVWGLQSETLKLMIRVTKTTHHAIWLVISSAMLAVTISSPNATSTPELKEAGTQKLNTPGLWLSTIHWQGPHTKQGQKYTFRVYCPTAMLRDVSNGNWGEAKKLSEMQGRGYPTGVPSLAFQQACQ